MLMLTAYKLKSEPSICRELRQISHAQITLKIKQNK
jgi:hypothetical protein